MFWDYAHSPGCGETLPMLICSDLGNNNEPKIINHINHIEFDNLIVLNLKGLFSMYSGNNIESVESLSRIKLQSLNEISLGKLSLILEDNQIVAISSLRKMGIFLEQLRVLNLGTSVLTRGFNKIIDGNNLNSLS